MKQTPKFTQKKVTQLVTKYRQIMDLESWTINIKFTTKNKNFYAEATVMPDYLKAYITFNLFRMKTLKELQQTVFHELFHIWVSPLSHPAKYLVDKRAKTVLHSLEETLATQFERFMTRELGNKK